MRQVIKRFLNHLESEKNASLLTIETYRYDLHKFDDYLVKRLGNRFLPGDVTRDHIRDYLSGSRKSAIKSPTVPLHARGRSQGYGHFSNTRHHAGLLRDNPAADIPLPKIRLAEVHALSREDCERLLSMVGTNRSPFRKIRDRAMIVTFLSTGAKQGEIVRR